MVDIIARATTYTRIYRSRGTVVIVVAVVPASKDNNPPIYGHNIHMDLIT